MVGSKPSRFGPKISFEILFKMPAGAGLRLGLHSTGTFSRFMVKDGSGLPANLVAMVRQVVVEICCAAIPNVFVDPERGLKSDSLRRWECCAGTNCP